MAEKPKLYMETTIPSYLVARPSRDVIVLARQQMTRDWWDNRRHECDIYVSQLVLEESGCGDAGYAKQRLELLGPFPQLPTTPEVVELADRLFTAFNLPARVAADAQHLATAIHYGMDYLLTWNCAHLANAHVPTKLGQIAIEWAIRVPVVCTPEELIGKGS